YGFFFIVDKFTEVIYCRHKPLFVHLFDFVSCFFKLHASDEARSSKTKTIFFSHVCKRFIFCHKKKEVAHKLFHLYSPKSISSSQIYFIIFYKKAIQICDRLHLMTYGNVLLM